MNSCVMCGKPGTHDYPGGTVCSAACLASWEGGIRRPSGDSPSVLEEARRAVASRVESYGPPRDNHERTANLWSIYLRGVLRDKVNVSARDVCLLNILQKVSRDIHRPKRDNLVDIAGYAENANLCEDLPCRSQSAEPSSGEEHRG